jgi:hypothetical protein
VAILIEMRFDKPTTAKESMLREMNREAQSSVFGYRSLNEPEAFSVRLGVGLGNTNSDFVRIPGIIACHILEIVDNTAV